MFAQLGHITERRFLEPATEYTIYAHSWEGCSMESQIATLTFTTLGAGEVPSTDPRLRLVQALDTQATVELLNPPFPNPSQNASTRWRYSLEIKGGARIRPYECRLAITRYPNTPNTCLLYTSPSPRDS